VKNRAGPRKVDRLVVDAIGSGPFLGRQHESVCPESPAPKVPNTFFLSLSPGIYLSYRFVCIQSLYECYFCWSIQSFLCSFLPGSTRSYVVLSQVYASVHLPSPPVNVLQEIRVPLPEPTAASLPRPRNKYQSRETNHGGRLFRSGLALGVLPVEMRSDHFCRSFAVLGQLLSGLLYTYLIKLEIPTTLGC
jgi:hypothetical protein